MSKISPHKNALFLEARTFENEMEWVKKTKPTEKEREKYCEEVLERAKEVESFEYRDGSFFGAILQIMSDGTLRLHDRVSEEALCLFPEELEAICKWYLDIN